MCAVHRPSHHRRPLLRLRGPDRTAEQAGADAVEPAGRRQRGGVHAQPPAERDRLLRSQTIVRFIRNLRCTINNA